MHQLISLPGRPNGALGRNPVMLNRKGTHASLAVKIHQNNALRLASPIVRDFVIAVAIILELA